MNIFERPLQEEPVNIFSAPPEANIFNQPENFEETIVWGDTHTDESEEDFTDVPVEDLLEMTSLQLEAEGYEFLSDLLVLIRNSYTHGF